MDGTDNREPKLGQVWSLKGRDDIPALLPPAVVLTEQRGSQWLAVPLFSEDRMAAASDRKLEPEPDWLFGEVWCAAGCAGQIHSERLFRPMGDLGVWAVRELKAALAGQPCSLPSGAALIEGIGDPREAFHEELKLALRLCGGATLVEHASARLRVALDAVRNAVTATIRGIELAPRPVLAPQFRGPQSSIEAPDATWEVPVEGHDAPALIHCCRGRKGWRLSVAWPGLRCAELRGADRRVELQPLGRQLVTGPGDALPDGDYEIVLNGTEVLPVSLEK